MGTYVSICGERLPQGMLGKMVSLAYLSGHGSMINGNDLS